MFRLFRRKPRPERPDFESFLHEYSMRDRNASVERVLSEYINRYRLAVRKSLNEPQSVTGARTRLQILEGTPFADPALCPDPQMQEYIAVLRANVAMADELHPDILAAMKARER
jgi:hypothetical protein